jgi:hypothetical protein
VGIAPRSRAVGGMADQAQCPPEDGCTDSQGRANPLSRRFTTPQAAHAAYVAAARELFGEFARAE